jgi:heterodisulfide reductase subunit A
MQNRTALIIGGGITGLAAAANLADTGIGALIVEKKPHLGGHAAQYACKATSACVKCGACLVDQKIQHVIENPNIEIMTASTVGRIARDENFTAEIEQIKNGNYERLSRQVDAVIVATGFKPFDPRSKPYGYEAFSNVITNLELECMLRQRSVALRPSDNQPPDRMAFFQCVGSRDAKLGHLWCSRICCASALRLSRLIKMRRPQTEISFYYIDIQTFGKQFEPFYQSVKGELRLIRAIPGDIYPAENDGLKVTYYDAAEKQMHDVLFDLVVLSVGITPSENNRSMADLLQLEIGDEGFLKSLDETTAAAPEGVFAAGTACGPMSIADSIASAGQAALAAAAYVRSR